MIDKLLEAAELLVRHFGLFVAVVLTVWIPGNLLVNYLDFYVIPPENFRLSFRMYQLVEAILSPVPAAAVIAILSRSKLGRRATYREVMGVALRKWGPLFWARFVAGILIGLGFIAFIIPGIMLLLRYALLDQAVVVEGADPGEARRRSATLTKGRRWEILAVCLLFYVPFIVMTIAIYAPMIFLPILDQFHFGVFLDCCVNLGVVPIQIVMFLYYWEAAQSRPETAGVDSPDGLSAA
jgi:hypothetical protein